MEMVDLSRVIYDGMPKIPVLAGCARAESFLVLRRAIR